MKLGRWMGSGKSDAVEFSAKSLVIPTYSTENQDFFIGYITHALVTPSFIFAKTGMSV